jgi:hypothetical protein
MSLSGLESQLLVWHSRSADLPAVNITVYKHQGTISSVLSEAGRLAFTTVSRKHTCVYSSIFQHVLYRLVLALYKYRGTAQRITRIHLIPSSFPGRAELRHCRSLSAGELDGFNGQWFNTGPRSE